MHDMHEKVNVVVGMPNSILRTGLVAMLKEAGYLPLLFDDPRAITGNSNGRHQTDYLIVGEGNKPIVDWARSFINHFNSPAIMVLAGSLRTRDVDDLKALGVNAVLPLESRDYDVIDALPLLSHHWIIDKSLVVYEDLRFQSLTGSEWETIRLIAAGRSSNQIAAMANLTREAIKTRRQGLMRKLAVNNTANLVRWYLGNQQYNPQASSHGG